MMELLFDEAFLKAASCAARLSLRPGTEMRQRNATRFLSGTVLHPKRQIRRLQQTRAYCRPALRSLPLLCASTAALPASFLCRGQNMPQTHVPQALQSAAAMLVLSATLAHGLQLLPAAAVRSLTRAPLCPRHLSLPAEDIIPTGDQVLTAMQRGKLAGDAQLSPLESAVNRLGALSSAIAIASTRQELSVQTSNIAKHVAEELKGFILQLMAGQVRGRWGRVADHTRA